MCFILNLATGIACSVICGTHCYPSISGAFEMTHNCENRIHRTDSIKHGLIVINITTTITKLTPVVSGCSSMVIN